MISRRYVPVSCSSCGDEWNKRKDAIPTWSGKCMSCSRTTNGMGKHSIPVNCMDCGAVFQKRADSTKAWSGRCKSCAQIERSKEPEVRKARSISAKKQVAAMGGIPNGNRFTSDDGGENHWNWQGGKTNARISAMGKKRYIGWRKSVFMRDYYTCQECGIKGGWLEAHHIKAWSTHKEERYNVSNGMTLCRPCHIKTDNYGRKAA